MKLKTKKAAAKRFRVTGGGKIKMRHSFHSHILTKKSSKRKKRLTRSAILSAADHRRVRRMLLLA
jgi:large subunit ribosomal protein L35